MWVYRDIYRINSWRELRCHCQFYIIAGLIALISRERNDIVDAFHNVALSIILDINGTKQGELGLEPLTHKLIGDRLALAQQANILELLLVGILITTQGHVVLHCLVGHLVKGIARLGVAILISLGSGGSMGCLQYNQTRIRLTQGHQVVVFSSANHASTLGKRGSQGSRVLNDVEMTLGSLIPVSKRMDSRALLRMLTKSRPLQ